MVDISTHGDIPATPVELHGSGQYYSKSFNSGYLFKKQNDSVNTSLSNYGRTMSKTTADSDRIDQDGFRYCIIK
jgi:hypothetical protein